MERFVYKVYKIVFVYKYLFNRRFAEKIRWYKHNKKGIRKVRKK